MFEKFKSFWLFDISVIPVFLFPFMLMFVLFNKFHVNFIFGLQPYSEYDVHIHKEINYFFSPCTWLLYIS